MSDYREEADDLAEFTWGLEGPDALETSRCAIQQALQKAHKKGRDEALQECLDLIKRLNASGAFPACPAGLTDEEAYYAGEDVGFDRGKEGCVMLLEELIDKEQP